MFASKHRGEVKYEALCIKYVKMLYLFSNEKEYRKYYKEWAQVKIDIFGALAFSDVNLLGPEAVRKWEIESLVKNDASFLIPYRESVFMYT